MARKLFQLHTNKRPRWAKNISAEQYDLFHEKLLKLSDGTINSDDCNSAGELLHGVEEINLINLVTLCSNLPPERWDKEIRQWLNVIGASTGSISKNQPSSIGKLKLQLYPVGYLGNKQEEQEYPVREDIPGILTTAVIDESDRLVVATKAFLKEHSQYTDKTLNVLITRLKTETPYSVDFVKLHGNDEMLVAVIHDDAITAATHALALDALYPQLVGEYGALVGIPHRHMIVVKRLDEKPSEELMEQLGTLVQSIAETQAGAISSSIYYSDDNKFRLA